MSETKNPGDHTLSVSPTKTLSLKRPVEAGIVRQSFSHGRSKAVVVEKVKRRALGTEPHAPRESVAQEPLQPAVAPQPPRPQHRSLCDRKARRRVPSSGVILRSLTEEERDARSRALTGAHEREVEERKRAEIETKAREEREAREREERAAAEARKREEEARRMLEAESKRRSEQEAKTPPRRRRACARADQSRAAQGPRRLRRDDVAVPARWRCRAAPAGLRLPPGRSRSRTRTPSASSAVPACRRR